MKTNPIKRSKTRHIVSVLMMLLLAAFSATAQSSSRSIRGIVVDENGDPLPGAVVKQVMQKDGESIVSIITDNQGHFGLSVPNGTKAIEVSFLGFDSQKINLTNAADYRIQMVASNNYLSEVVVTGYQTISKERATGSFVKVDSEKLNEKRLNSLSSMLEGTVAGYNDGLIRGVTSMNVSTTPLYVVDGFPIENMAFDQYGSLNESLPNLNMEDVESITVLKDAAAASIYGSRAANGVIVITTKRPKDLGQVDVSLSATLTVHPYSYYTGNVGMGSTESKPQRRRCSSLCAKHARQYDLSERWYQDHSSPLCWQDFGSRDDLNAQRPRRPWLPVLRPDEEIC